MNTSWRAGRVTGGLDLWDSEKVDESDPEADVGRRRDADDSSYAGWPGE